MKKLFVVFLLAFAPSIAMASVDSDYFNATDTAATSTFSGSIDVSGSAKLGSGSGLMEMVNGVLKAIPNSIHIDSTDFWGFGTTTQYSPLVQWEFVNQSSGGTGGGVVTTNYDTSSPFSSFVARSARGTIASPSALLSGNILGQYGFTGFDGVNFPSSPANIRGIANGNWSSTSHGVDIAFMTTVNGSVSRTEKMRLRNNGQLLIGSTTAWSNNLLAVDGDIALTGSVNPKGDVNVNNGGIHIGSVTSPYNGFRLSVQSGPSYIGSVVIGNTDINLLSTSTLYVEGTTTSHGALNVTTSGTSTVTIDSDTVGGCIVMKDSDGSGYTYITANNGSLIPSTTPCN